MSRRQRQGFHDAAMDSISSAFAAPNGNTTTALSISGTAAAATGLVENATYRLWSDVACFVLFAASGDATTSMMPLTAELPEWITLQDLTRVSAITAGASGTLYLTRMG
jgi:hypothetical protein